FFIEKMTLNWPDIVDDNLQAAVAAKLVDIELISQLHFTHAVIRPEGGIDIKSNTIPQWTAADRFDHHLQTTFAHQPLLQQTEMTVKQRLREHLPPRASIAQQLRHFHGHFGRA